MMINLIIAFALFVAGILFSMYGATLNNDYINVDYIMVVPFFYYLIIAIFPRWEGRKLEASVGGIFACIVLFTLIDNYMDLELITPILITTVASALITYIALKLMYRKKELAK